MLFGGEFPSEKQTKKKKKKGGGGDHTNLTLRTDKLAMAVKKVWRRANNADAASSHSSWRSFILDSLEAANHELVLIQKRIPGFDFVFVRGSTTTWVTMQ